MISPCTASSVRGHQIGGVTEGTKDHIRGSVDNFSVRVSGSIIQEILSSSQGSFGALGCRASNLIKCMEHSEINRAGIK